MRRSVHLLLFLCGTLAATAQTTWWGMTSLGGANDLGTIFTITEGGTFTKRYDFNTIPGRAPKADVLKASNGLYYGTTEFGGTDDAGVLWSYNPSTGAYTVLQNFSSATSGGSATGSRPVRGLVEVTVSGTQRIYGVCQFGGANNRGSIWEWNINTGIFTRRVSFAGPPSSPEEPYAGLVSQSGSATTLWGTSTKGGTNNTGTIYTYTAGGSSVTIRRSFDALAGNTSGRTPRAALVQAQNGRFYGTCSGGGANGFGTVFEITTANVYTVVKAFGPSGNADGTTPFGEMVQFSNNVLYGTCSTGGTGGSGTIFRIDATALPATFTKVFDFGVGTGTNCLGRLIKAANNLVYGVTNAGGTGSNGVIFSFDPATNTYATVANLAAGGFSGQWGGLLEDGSGVFVGLSLDGGSASSGALYRYSVATNTFTELVGFSFSNGSVPRGRLLRASDGLFYGVTSTGGVNNKGVLFSFDPNTSTYQLRHSFGTGTGGDFPLGSLLEVGGKLYGTCSEGGNSGLGVIFEYTLSNGTLVKKVDLLANDGGAPRAGLFKPAGNPLCYLLTTSGGTNGKGSILTYLPGAGAATPVFQFSTSTGSAPLGDLMQASNGLLYGTLSDDGTTGAGSLFSFNPSNNAFVKLLDMDVLLGGVPCGDLIQLPSTNKLYGMAREGGTGAGGTLFSWDFGTNTYTQEIDLDAPTQGSFSESNLILGTDGQLYGTTSAGGANGSGTLFRFNTSTLALTVLQTFSGVTNGASPFDGLATEVVPTSDVKLSARLFLEGPFVSGTGLMNDALRTQPAFPLSEPFTALGFTNVVSGSINASVLATTGNNAITDWLLVELRNKNNSAQVVTAVPALLQRDGDVVALDGVSPVAIAQPADNYFVAFRHRNHLGVMTLNSLALSGTATSLDMTTGAVPTFGTAAQKQVGSVWTSWAGNATPNNQLKYTGSGNDRDPILLAIGGSVPTNTITGYRVEDCNMDAVVKYTGSANDRDIILLNIGGSVPTNTRAEQLP
jgi:uncharacterized repeat protein (TIGR03803 family)